MYFILQLLEMIKNGHNLNASVRIETKSHYLATRKNLDYDEHRSAAPNSLNNQVSALYMNSYQNSSAAATMIAKKDNITEAEI